MQPHASPPMQESTVSAAAGIPTRLWFVDHLRAALVILVVLHHVAIVYGASTPFYYVEPPFTDPLAYITLLAFALFNQAWFMGALFLIAGYFTPGSFERKGAGSFLKSRLVRLGIPLLVFFFILGPLSSIGYWQMPAELTGITDPLSVFAYPFLLGLGPMWFVALLLIFDFGYALWRRLTRDRAASPAGESPPPGYIGVIIFTLALALVTYLLRFVIPLGREILDFPTLGYLPQYLSFFIIGIVAYRRDWFRTIPGSMGVRRICDRAGGNRLPLPPGIERSIVLLRALRSRAFFGERILAVGCVCALGLALRSRNDPGRADILPPLFQRG